MVFIRLKIKGIIKKESNNQKTSDHYILINQKLLPIEIDSNEKTKIIQDKNIIENNWNRVTNFLTKKCNHIRS